MRSYGDSGDYIGVTCITGAGGSARSKTYIYDGKAFSEIVINREVSHEAWHGLEEYAGKTMRYFDDGDR